MKKEMFWRVMAGVVIGFIVAILCVIMDYLFLEEEIQLGARSVWRGPSVLFVIFAGIIIAIASIFNETKNLLNYPVAIIISFVIIFFLVPAMTEHIAYQNVEKIETVFNKAIAGEFGTVDVPVKDLEEAEWMVKYLYCYKSPSGGRLRADSRLSFAKIVFGEKREYTFSIACGGRNDELHVFSYNKDKVLK